MNENNKLSRNLIILSSLALLVFFSACLSSVDSKSMFSSYEGEDVIVPYNFPLDIVFTTARQVVLEMKFTIIEENTELFYIIAEKTQGVEPFNAGERIRIHMIKRGGSMTLVKLKSAPVGRAEFLAHLKSAVPKDSRVDLQENLNIKLCAWQTEQLLPPIISVPFFGGGKTDKPAQEAQKLEEVLPSTVSKKWAVIVGISKYKDTRIPSLRYADRDAKAFFAWITSEEGGKYPPAQVKLLLNDNASSMNIKHSLFEWLNQSLEEDIVTIYFAGHGSPQSPDQPENLFLLPYDTQYDSIAATAFPMWDIETALKRFIRAKRVVVIADACHSGGVGQTFDITRRDSRGIRKNKINASLHRLSKINPGICVICASGEREQSQESKDWGNGHGVFTYFLLKGLRGEADYNNDQRVSLGELIPYFSEMVRRATRNAQCPEVAGKFDPMLCISD